MATSRSEFDRDLHALEAELKRLEADYNMFFAGRLPRLPWDQRARVDAMVKRMDRMHIQNTGDRFRFQTVQARWAAFTELWERQLKAQEMGRRPGRPAGTARAAEPRAESRPPEPRGAEASPQSRAPESPSAAPAPAAKDRVVAVTSLKDPGAQQDRVQALYEQMTLARREAGEKPVEYERFSELVRAQVKKLGAGGEEVAFRVELKNGKVKLAAEKAGKS
ncbi:MAG: MXAN_5187 C-terminal domain-containing protein [Vicinamibacterales bacterium]